MKIPISLADLLKETTLNQAVAQLLQNNQAILTCTGVEEITDFEYFLSYFPKDWTPEKIIKQKN